MYSVTIKPVAIQDLRGGKSFLQSGFWGLLKSFFGWTPYTFCYRGTPLLVLVRTILPGISLAYIPHGPRVSDVYRNSVFLSRFGKELKRHLPSSVIYIRFDLPWGKYADSAVSFSFSPHLVKSVVDIQPPDTVILSLTDAEEKILKRMKHKTRYNIRLAFKKGVVVSMGGKELLSDWYELYRETARRDRITIHSHDYYLKLFDLAASGQVDAPEIVLFTATWEKELLAGIIVVLYRGRATYLYGASSNSRRNLMPNYALQWEAIKYAKKQGCETYDFFGIPPEDNSDHPMYGLYRFKTGFGGRIYRYPGCWDLPLKPVCYRLYRLVEKIRRWYYKKFRK